MQSQDRREYGRTEVMMEVSHTCRGQTATSRAKNLSYAGLQVQQPDISLMHGDRLGLAFTLPGSDRRVLASAEVIFRSKDLAGMQFIFVPKAMRRHLNAFVTQRLVGAWFR